jgi:hypothetical protein
MERRGRTRHQQSHRRTKLAEARQLKTITIGGGGYKGAKTAQDSSDSGNCRLSLDCSRTF